MRSHTLKAGDDKTIPWEGLWRVFRMFIKPSRNPWRRQTALQMLICRTGWRWCRTRLSPSPAINYSYYWLAKQCHFHALGDHGGATFTRRDDPTNPDQLCCSTTTMSKEKSIMNYYIFIMFICVKYTNRTYTRVRVQCDHCIHAPELLMERCATPKGFMKNKLMCAPLYDPLWYIPLQITKRDSGSGTWWTESRI